MTFDRIYLGDRLTCPALRGVRCAFLHGWRGRYARRNALFQLPSGERFVGLSRRQLKAKEGHDNGEGSQPT